MQKDIAALRSEIDAKLKAVNGSVALTLSNGFSVKNYLTGAAQARYAITSSGNTIIYVSVDADASSEFEITLKGRHTLNAGDFVL